MIIYDDASLNEFLEEDHVCLVRAYYHDEQGNIKLSQPFEAKDGIVKAEDIKKHTQEINKPLKLALYKCNYIIQHTRSYTIKVYAKEIRQYLTEIDK